MLNFTLKDEDLLLFKYLLESPSGSLTREQIHQNIYKYKRLQNTNDRLNKLKKNDLVRVVADPINIKQTLIVIGEVGFELVQGLKNRMLGLKKSILVEEDIKENGKVIGSREVEKNILLEPINPYFYNLKNISFKQYEHDFLLNELRFSLEKIWSDWRIKWVAGDVFYKRYKEQFKQRSNGDKIKLSRLADAVLLFPNDIKVAIELEHNTKYKSRYDAIFKSYVSMYPLFHAVIYVCTDDRVYNFINELLKSPLSSLKTRLYGEDTHMSSGESLFFTIDHQGFCNRHMPLNRKTNQNLSLGGLSNSKKVFPAIYDIKKK